MPRGTVKFYDYGKGFGFVVPDQRGPDVFLWGEAVTTAKLKNLKALDRVEYEVGRHPLTGRPCVVKIGLLDASSPPSSRQECNNGRADELLHGATHSKSTGSPL
jgi:cold shock protein